MCSTDSRIPDYVNEAQQRMMAKGKWVGTTQLYRICVGADSCLVWPRQIETIEAWALCDSPGIIRNGFYEFAGNGPGILSESSCWFRTLIDKGRACAFDEIGENTLTKRVQVTADVPEDAGARILLQGYDENGAWIRTEDGGVWIDGEYVAISTTVTRTLNFFTTLTGVQKPVTNGPVRLAEYDDTGSMVIKQLAYYESDEEVPDYRKSFIPGMANINESSDSSTCTNKTVTVVAKLRHIPVVNDIDWLTIGSLGAFKLMVQAILKEERNLMGEAAAYEGKAFSLLQDELHSYEGDGAIPVLKTESRDTWGAGVMNIVDCGGSFF